MAHNAKESGVGIKLPNYWLSGQSTYDEVPSSVEKELAKILPQPEKNQYPEWWIEYGNYGEDGYELLVNRCDKGHATGRKSYSYYATISLFDKHINKPYFELREDVSSAVYRHDYPEEDITYHIFGKFKTLRGAILSLVRKGNYTRNGRKAQSFYK